MKAFASFGARHARVLACGTIAAASLGLILTSTSTTVDAHKAKTSPYSYNVDIFPLLRDNCGRCHVDGGPAPMSLMTYDKDGGAVWDGGSFRSADKSLYVFNRGEVIFKPTRQWKSPLTQITYPVEWIVRTAADFYTVKAVIDNQELDSRQSTGSIYWEGLSELFSSNGVKVGSGYLEMTGYGQPLRM